MQRFSRIILRVYLSLTIISTLLLSALLFSRACWLPKIDEKGNLSGAAVGIENGRISITHGNIMALSDGMGKILNPQPLRMGMPLINDLAMLFETRQRIFDSIENYSYASESFLGFGYREVNIRRPILADGSEVKGDIQQAFAWRNDFAYVRYLSTWPLALPMVGLLIGYCYRTIIRWRRNAKISPKSIGFEVIAQDQDKSRK